MIATNSQRSKFNLFSHFMNIFLLLNLACLVFFSHVDDYYKTEVWKENYASNIKPVNGEIFWAKTGKEPIGVPGFRKMPGRPKKKRIKPAHESPSKPNRVTRGGRTMTCSNCKQSEHNCGTCKNPPFVVQGPPRKRGRLRKNLASVIFLRVLLYIMLCFIKSF